MTFTVWTKFSFSQELSLVCYFCWWTVWLCWSLLVFSTEMFAFEYIVSSVSILGKINRNVLLWRTGAYIFWHSDFSVYLPGSNWFADLLRAIWLKFFWVKESWFHALMELDASKKLFSPDLSRRRWKRKARRVMWSWEGLFLWKQVRCILSAKWYAKMVLNSPEENFCVYKNTTV